MKGRESKEKRSSRKLKTYIYPQDQNNATHLKNKPSRLQAYLN